MQVLSSLKSAKNRSKDCQIVKDTPIDLETKACRLVANKCTLLARMDLQGNNYKKV